MGFKGVLLEMSCLAKKLADGGDPYPPKIVTEVTSPPNSPPEGGRSAGLRVKIYLCITVRTMCDRYSEQERK